MSYLDRLKDFISEMPPYDQPLKPLKPGFGGLGGDPWGRIPENYAKALLGDWHRHLSALDPYDAPDGFTLNCWAVLVHDCWWLYETHASRLVRDGWTAMDLFTVIPSQRGWGGLADRIQGARNVLLDDLAQAHWTRLGLKFSASLGIGEALRGSDARLVWELAKLKKLRYF